MQVYGNIVESSWNYRRPYQYHTLRGAVQSVCIHVYLELGELLCHSAGYLEIICDHAVLKCENSTDVIVKWTTDVARHID